MAYSKYTETIQVTLFDGDWYGVSGLHTESPTLTRIASDMDFHASLPIHSLMKACLVNDNGTVNYYLKPTDWSKKLDESASNLDGTDGQVMIEIPEHWYLDFNDNVFQRSCIRTTAKDGWTHFYKSYVGAYEAAAQRSAKKLASVKNMATDYRGGNDNAAYDGETNTFLGKCVTRLPIQASSGGEDYRTYAQNRGAYWHPITWKIRTALQRLYIIEYASKNSQLAVNGVLDANGYKQGGLGMGVTDVDSDVDAFNGRYPFIPIGQSDSLASGSGEVSYNVPFAAPEAVTICRYRGIENIFGHIMEYNEGLVVKHDLANNLRNIYYVSNPSDFTSTDETKGTLIATINDGSGCITGISNNYFIPSTDESTDYAKYFCDYAAYGLSNVLNVYLHVRSGGYSGGGVNPLHNGIFWTKSEDPTTMAITYISTRLCCHPNGY